ncbi:unannotated protein [freshwater metagenome]|uniref:Unannotated protein n=1 Tax=freshwater metagenome TaxID=449393 RepID=A0A6J6TH77_9ZZZZ
MKNPVTAVLIGIAAIATVACSDNGGSSAATSTTVAQQSAPDPSSTELPVLDQIPLAIAAIEAQLGGPQQYFEINATAKLVNLFVALNNGAIAQSWVFVGGELSAREGEAASGGTFAATGLDFDPALVFSKVREQLPGATLDSFYIHGDGQGHLLYGVLLTSAQGGGLDVVLGPKGEVKSVDPVN